MAKALIAGDPEIDPETTGSFLRDTSRVFVNSDRKIVYGVTQIEIVRNPDGTEKARRPKKAAMPNVNAEQPLVWSGKLLPKREVYNKFVFVAKLQVVHVNGITYDFLFDIARQLEEKNSLLLVGAGPKADPAADPPVRGPPVPGLPRRPDPRGRVLSAPAPVEHRAEGPGGHGRCGGECVMSLINRGRMEIKLGEYAVGAATVLADPTLVARIQDYRRHIASRMVPVEPEQILKRFPAAPTTWSA